MSKEGSGEIIRLPAEKGERIRNSQFSNLDNAGDHYRCHDSGKLGRAGPGHITLCQQHMPRTCTRTQPGTSDEQDRQLLKEV